MTPLELSSKRPKTSWFDPVWSDAACLHFTIYVTNVFASHVCGRQSSNRVLAHFGTTLRILQERMGDAYISDSTLLVVVGLAMTATAFGHHDTAQKHLDGLARMVALRGGCPALVANCEQRCAGKSATPGSNRFWADRSGLTSAFRSAQDPGQLSSTTSHGNRTSLCLGSPS